MARALWEKTLAYDFADKLGKDVRAYNTAGYIVRDLTLRNDLVRVLGRARITAPADLTDTEVAPPAFIQTMTKLWKSLGVGAGGKHPGTGAVRAGLKMRARSAFRRSSASEHAAAHAISSEAQRIDWTALLGAELVPETVEIGDGGSWDGLRGLDAAVLAGSFGSLRDDLQAASPAGDVAAVLATYDGLVRDALLRREMVKRVQSWMKTHGLYAALVDGWWGSKSEHGFVTLVPSAAGRPTTFGDLRVLRETSNLTLQMSHLLAAGISRDIWLREDASPSPARAPASPPEPDRSSVEEETVVLVQDEPTREGAELPVVTVPDGSPAPEVVRVQAVEEGGGRRLGWGLLATGALLVVAGVWGARRTG